MKPGRNDPCPCGSGKKYKYCCGRHEASGAFPGIDLDPLDPDKYDQYQEFVKNWKGDGEPPSLMEMLCKPNMATTELGKFKEDLKSLKPEDIFKDLKKKPEGGEPPPEGKKGGDAK